MANAKALTDEKIEKIAELKAGGQSWERIARETGLSTHTLRRWRTANADVWTNSFRRAEMELFSDALAEAVIALRKQLRGEKPEIVREAAKQLLTFRVQLQKLLPPQATTDGLFTEADLVEYKDDCNNSKTVADQPEDDDPRRAA